MKTAPKNKTLALSAIALLIAACGGSGGDGTTPAVVTPPAAKSLALSGTAATGLALANSTVDVKCATGTATATTDGNGQYTLTITDGALPCMIKVTGTVNGAPVTMHSVTEAGATTNGTTTAVANVTPLTELIVAQMAAKLPSDLFASFGSGSTVTAEQLKAATTAVLTVLKDVTGIDITAIDPFKAPLVAATSTNPTGGNTYDQLLDQVAQTIPAGSLAAVTQDIATAASSGSSSSAALTEVITNVDSGAMPGCPTVKSGNYRAVEYFGRSFVRNIDFKTMKFNLANGTALYDIKPLDPAKPCEFVAAGVSDGLSVEYSVAMGTGGAGTYRSANLTGGTGTIGHIFPVQSALTINDVQGAWTMVQSGDFASTAGLEHALSKLTFNSSTLSVCDLDSVDNPVCGETTDLTVSTRTDGGLNLSELVDGNPVVAAQIYGFRNASGAITLYGTTNAANAAASPTTVRTHFVATPERTLSLPAVNAVSRYFDAQLTFLQSGVTSTLGSDSTTVTAVNSSTSTVNRLRASDGRADVVRFNYPIAGVRMREAGTHNGTPFAAALQLVTTNGVTVSINAFDTTHFYAISVSRP